MTFEEIYNKKDYDLIDTVEFLKQIEKEELTKNYRNKYTENGILAKKMIFNPLYTRYLAIKNMYQESLLRNGQEKADIEYHNNMKMFNSINPYYERAIEYINWEKNSEANLIDNKQIIVNKINEEIKNIEDKQDEEEDSLEE